MDLQAFRSIELFASLDPVQLAHLDSIMQPQQVTKNTVIFDEGDVPAAFFVIAKGKVRISRMIPGMGEEALAILDTGKYFGEMELIPDVGVIEPRAARATAHEDCTLQVFKIEDFHTLLRTDSELAVAILWNFVRTLSNRLKLSNDKVMATFAMAQFH